jgi:hypothetical protein
MMMEGKIYLSLGEIIVDAGHMTLKELVGYIKKKNLGYKEDFVIFSGFLKEKLSIFLILNSVSLK